MNNNEIILYQPDGSISLEVRVENETIWLTQKQMAQLYGTAVPAISKHIKNIFDSGELQAETTVSKMEIVQQEGCRSISRVTSIYNLDMIIAVGYRVNSHQATTFRIWATKVLKEYLYRGFAMYQRMDRIENQVNELSNQVQSLVHAALPPTHGVFFDGQIFDAYVFAANLIKAAKESIVLIDNYIDESVLHLLSKRATDVSARIVTRKISPVLAADLAKYNRQYPPVSIEESSRYHDRFLVIDGTVYHIGASLKDLGKKLFAFSRLDIPVEMLAP
ncbi:MAG: RhuM family protein [Bacteroidales bacterium]|nr:RhuM family protein [Bacteroidales bacterium]